MAKNARCARITTKPAGRGIAGSTSWPWRKQRVEHAGSDTRSVFPGLRITSGIVRDAGPGTKTALSGSFCSTKISAGGSTRAGGAARRQVLVPVAGRYARDFAFSWYLPTPTRAAPPRLRAAGSGGRAHRPPAVACKAQLRLGVPGQRVSRAAARCPRGRMNFALTGRLWSDTRLLCAQAGGGRLDPLVDGQAREPKTLHRQRRDQDSQEPIDLCLVAKE